jgi:cytochrome c peroxidase
MAGTEGNKETLVRNLILVMTSLVLAIGLFALANQHSALADDPGLTPVEELGKALFFDANLSVNGMQSCATCHGPEVGFTGPDSEDNATTGVYPGAIETRYGNRKPPASAYGGESPLLYYDEDKEGWFGGMFWDGRASGWTLGDPLAEQAQGPFLNPLEQALPNARAVVAKVAISDYTGLFEEVWGAGSLDLKDVDGTYERIARSIAAYERSEEVNPFSSKFDAFWDAATAAGKDVTKIKFAAGDDGMGGGGGMGPGGGGGGMGPGGGGGMTDPYRWQAYRGYGLTDAELRGLAAFNDPNRADCASCHSLALGSDGYPLFTDFSYHNLGVPKSPDNPFYLMPRKWNPDGENWVDLGLGGFLQSEGYGEEVYGPELGKVKVPTVRNVDLRPSEDFVKVFGHNGYFKTLEDIVVFYAWMGLTMNGGLGMGGNGMDGCSGGGMDPGMEPGMGGGTLPNGVPMAMMCSPDLFPEPEVDDNLTPMNHFNMMDQYNIVVFLKTLSDGYFER